jgi:hypothetical protein
VTLYPGSTTQATNPVAHQSLWPSDAFGRSRRSVGQEPDASARFSDELVRVAGKHGHDLPFGARQPNRFSSAETCWPARSMAKCGVFTTG